MVVDSCFACTIPFLQLTAPQMKSIRFALALMTSIALAACSGGSGTSSGTSSVSSEVLLQDVFPTSGDALAWSLKATNATELKTYFEKAVSAADKIQIIPTEPLCEILFYKHLKLLA